MSSNDFHRIADAIMGLQLAMRNVRMEPAVINLSCAEDGRVLQSLLRRDVAYQVELGRLDPETGIAVNQVEIAGTLVRWPSTRRARPRGGWDWE